MLQIDVKSVLLSYNSDFNIDFQALIMVSIPNSMFCLNRIDE